MLQSKHNMAIRALKSYAMQTAPSTSNVMYCYSQLKHHMGHLGHSNRTPTSLVLCRTPHTPVLSSQDVAWVVRNSSEEGCRRLQSKIHTHILSSDPAQFALITCLAQAFAMQGQWCFWTRWWQDCHRALQWQRCKDHVPNRPTLACLAMDTACHMQKPPLLLHHDF